MLKMLIAVDGSEHSNRAIDTVARLARESATLEVVLMNVRDGPVYHGELPATTAALVTQVQKKHQDEVLAGAQRRAEAAGLKIASLQRAEGLAAPEIVRAANDLGVDHIVLGTRGMGAAGAFFLGSVAQRVVHMASMPVLLVK